MNTKPTYPGLRQDKHSLTMLARVVIDGWLFGFIPETEECAGWSLGQMQALADKVDAEWDKYSNLPSRLPAELRERHAGLYKKATEQAREQGWDPELGDDE
jgi:hypothetical protein